LNGKRVEEPTDAKNERKARRTLNERFGQVAKGEPPAAVSKIRLAELYADMQADYRNKGQDLKTLAVRWKHLEIAFATCEISPIPVSKHTSRHGAPRRPPSRLLKNEIAVLRRMLRLGYRHRKVAQLPGFPEIAA